MFRTWKYFKRFLTDITSQTFDNYKLNDLKYIIPSMFDHYYYFLCKQIEVSGKTFWYTELILYYLYFLFFSGQTLIFILIKTNNWYWLKHWCHLMKLMELIDVIDWCDLKNESLNMNMYRVEKEVKIWRIRILVLWSIC